MWTTNTNLSFYISRGAQGVPMVLRTSRWFHIRIHMEFPGNNFLNIKNRIAPIETELEVEKWPNTELFAKQRGAESFFY